MQLWSWGRVPQIECDYGKSANPRARRNYSGRNKQDLDSGNVEEHPAQSPETDENVFGIQEM
jgi:hypothetical protein